MNRRDLNPRLRWIDDRTCQVPGCDGRAPGTHPFCRKHARQLPSDQYRRLRFQGDDKQRAAALKTLKET